MQRPVYLCSPDVHFESKQCLLSWGTTKSNSPRGSSRWDSTTSCVISKTQTRNSVFFLFSTFLDTSLTSMLNCLCSGNVGFCRTLLQLNPSTLFLWGKTNQHHSGHFGHLGLENFRSGLTICIASGLIAAIMTVIVGVTITVRRNAHAR